MEVGSEKCHVLFEWPLMALGLISVTRYALQLRKYLTDVGISGDCAGLKSLRCQATKSQVVNLSVSMAFCEEESDNRCLEKCVTVNVENHTTCTCQCHLDDTSCSPIHVSRLSTSIFDDVNFCRSQFLSTSTFVEVNLYLTF